MVTHTLSHACQRALPRHHHTAPHRPLKEWYSSSHVRRLLQYQALTEFPEQGTKVLCSTVHPQPCTRCTSCHFCR
jgi:hypothetical protein